MWHVVMLILDDNGDVWTFGNNKYGQCGININQEHIKIPTRVYGLHDIVQIVGNSYSACVDVEGHVRK